MSHRNLAMINNLYELIDKTKFDPILDVFKSNEMLQEFYMNRIIEIINSHFNNEKERQITKLEDEMTKLTQTFQQIEKNSTEMTHALNEQKRINGSLNEQLQVKGNHIEKLNLENLNLNEKYNSLHDSYHTLKDMNENILKENEILRSKINLLDIELIKTNERSVNLEEYSRKLIEEHKVKDSKLEDFRQNFEMIKEKQNEIDHTMELLMRENDQLKTSIEDKNNLNDDLITKLSELHKECQAKMAELSQVKEENSKMQTEIEKVLKVKIKALKLKLQEKVNALEEKEKMISKLITRKMNN